MIKENLKLWDAVKKVDPKFCKNVSVSGKQPFTNIDAYYLIQLATAQVGPMGRGFGLKDVTIDEVHMGDTILLKLSGLFYHGDSEFPAFNAIKLMYKTSKGYDKIDEDAYKKIYTNTIGKMLSYVGYGADVYMGKFEDQQYVQETAHDFVMEEYHGYIDSINKAVTEAKDPDALLAFIYKKGEVDDIKKLPFDKAKEIHKAIEQKMKRIADANS